MGQAISSASRDLPKTRLAWSRTTNHDANTELGAHVERTLACFLTTGPKTFTERISGEETEMKYLFAWGLGVPGVLIVAWFLMSHH